jgi:UDP-glucose 4-epimerase
MNILVTGGCGFVGVPTIQRLVRAGHRVVAYDDLSRGSAEAVRSMEEEVQIVEGDIRDVELQTRTFDEHRPEVILHLAALHFIPACNRDPERCLSTNVLGTQSVLEAAARCRTLRGFVFASTAAVYEPSDLPHHEGSQLAPSDVYGSSKLAAEQLVQAFHSRTHIPTGIARLFNVYGPGETNPHLIPEVIDQARRATTLHVGDLSTARDYVFTEDVAIGFERVVETAAAGETLLCNLGTGQSRTGKDVVESITRVLDFEPTIEVESSRLRPSERPFLCADITNAKRLLGWTPATPFEVGLGLAMSLPFQTDDRC